MTPATYLRTRWTAGDDATAFDINQVTGQLSTKAALDFEGPPDDHVYTVTVTATDPSGETSMAMVTIEVTDVNEDPSVMGDASIDHPENSTALTATPTDYTASDPDTVADPVADLKWTLSGADAGKFELAGSGATRTLAFEDAPNYESPGDSGGNNVYEVTVVVTDSKRNTDEQDVTVKVTNVEETGTVTLSTLQPRVSFPVTATLADADNITAGSVSWQWYRGATAIENPPSDLPEECATVADNNDCAIKDATSDTYTPVTDDITDTLSAVATYTDGFANEGDAKDMRAGAAEHTVLADTRNRAPVFPDQDGVMDGRQTDQERFVPENVPLIGSNPATLLVRTIGDPVAATDSITANDGNQTPEVLTYSLGGADEASFSINRADGQLSTKAKLDKETKDTYTVTVTATDPSGETATVMVTIKVTDVDEAPEIMEGGLTVSGQSRVEYAENGMVAVATYTATSPDADMASWTLEGDDAGDFRIIGGMLTFRSSPDYENPTDMGMDNMYMVTIMADDGTYMDTHVVMVMVTNVEELGMLTGDASVDYDEKGTSAVGTYTADGPVDAIWSLEGDDMGAFSIGGSSGEMMFASPPDFEAPADMGIDNMYQVTVKAEAGGEMDMMDVTVMVTNVEEPGMVTLWAGADALTMAPQVGDTITGAVMDPDGGVTGETWQWSRTMDDMDSRDMEQLDAHRPDATGAAYMVAAGRHGLLPAGDGDVHGRGGHGHGHGVLAGDHDGDHHDDRPHVRVRDRHKRSPGEHGCRRRTSATR